MDLHFSRRRLLLSATISALPLPALAQAADRLAVVATFSILGDMVRAIGGDRVIVAELIGPNQDAHGYQPSPADARKLVAARLIVANGHGFEPYLDRLVKSAGTKAARATVADAIKPLVVKQAHGHGHAHAQTNADPHAWQSVPNARQYAAAIARALSAADAAGADHYAAGLKAYAGQLDTLDADIRRAIAGIPAERRVLTTTHDAFGYFAAEYGLTIQALQGVSGDNEPSAAEMAAIIRQLRKLKSPAVFLENVTDPRKLEQIAREGGARIGGTLYSDALSLANGPAPTYIDMMRHNVREIAKALAPQA